MSILGHRFCAASGFAALPDRYAQNLPRLSKPYGPDDLAQAPERIVQQRQIPARREHLESSRLYADFHGMHQNRKPKPELAQPDLFMSPAGIESRPEGALPEGFAYGVDRVPEALARDLVEQFANLPFKNFEFHGFEGNRRIVSYGWKYEYSGSGHLRASGTMPDFLDPLKRIAADFAGLESDDFQQALVTEYAPGASIGWHRDKPMFEDVVAFSFLNPCRLRFRRRNGGWDRAALSVAPRSAYLLRGPAREQWEHSVPAVGALRYAVTLRTFKQGQRPDG